jgi:transcriptional regulator with XRE-family HTH domain
MEDVIEMEQIPGVIPGYFASEDGRIWSSRRGEIRELKATEDSNGYRTVRLRPEGERGQITRTVHLLVLETFRGPRPSPDHEGAHDDGDSLNNRLSNLFWKTRAQNTEDKTRHGTSGNWAGTPARRTPKAVREEIRVLRVSEGLSLGELSRRFGVSRSIASRICRGLPKPEASGPFRGLTWERAVREWLLSEGYEYDGPIEEFARPVPGLVEGYIATEDGRVLSARQGKLAAMAQHPDGNGYLSLHVRYEGERGTTPVRAHLLVLAAFRGPRPGPGYDGAHDDGDSLNNRLSNLLWKTRFANIQDKARHGTMARGETHGQAKLTERQVAEIREACLAKGVEYAEAAARFGVSLSAVARACTGGSWSHILPAPARTAPRAAGGRGVKGEDAATSKLTEAMVRAMRRRNAAGEGYRELARDYGVNHNTVKRICLGEAWAHVPLEGAPREMPAGRTRLTSEQRNLVRSRNAAGEKYADLAREFGMHPNSIRLACLRAA